MLKRFWDNGGDLFIIIFIVISFVTCGLYIGYLITKNITCPAFSKTVNKPTKYNFWAGGCFVEIKPGIWVGTNKYHGVELDQK